MGAEGVEAVGREVGAVRAQQLAPRDGAPAGTERVSLSPIVHRSILDPLLAEDEGRLRFRRRVEVLCQGEAEYAAEDDDEGERQEDLVADGCSREKARLRVSARGSSTPRDLRVTACEASECTWIEGQIARRTAIGAQRSSHWGVLRKAPRLVRCVACGGVGAYRGADCRLRGGAKCADAEVSDEKMHRTEDDAGRIVKYGARGAWASCTWAISSACTRTRRQPSDTADSNALHACTAMEQRGSDSDRTSAATMAGSDAGPAPPGGPPTADGAVHRDHSQVFNHYPPTTKRASSTRSRSLRASRSRPGVGGDQDGDDGNLFAPEEHEWQTRSIWYQYLPFRGMYHDVRRRLPLYFSDWYIAFFPKNWERVVGATIRMYFLKSVWDPPVLASFSRGIRP